MNGGDAQLNGAPGTETARGWGSYTPIAVDPTDPNTRYAMNDNGTFILEGLPNVGVWKSTNGGATWRQTMTGPANVTDPKSSIYEDGGFGAGDRRQRGGPKHPLRGRRASSSGRRPTPEPPGPRSRTARTRRSESSGHPGYYKERGDLNNVWTNFVVTDPNQPQRIYYGDARMRCR